MQVCSNRCDSEECRRHKLRCDARKDYAKPCSRCRRLALECVVLRSWEPTKPRSRSDLRAEVGRLHARLRTLQAANPNASAPAVTPVSPDFVKGAVRSLEHDEPSSLQLEDCWALFMKHYAPQVVSTCENVHTAFSESTEVSQDIPLLRSASKGSHPA
jgi:hypothetical protein